MHHKGEVVDSSDNGLQGLQGHPKECTAVNVPVIGKREGHLQAGVSEKDLVGILRHPEADDAHVRISGILFN